MFFFSFLLTQVELSNGTWKEIERVEKTVESDVKEILDKVVDSLTQEKETSDENKEEDETKDEANCNGSSETPVKNGNLSASTNGTDITSLDDKV